MRKTFILFSILLLAEFANGQVISQPYDYPVKKGTVEWNSIKNYQSLRSVCQIPTEIVNQMTTEALLESVLKYPLLLDVFVFNTFQTGIENLKINFGAFNALSNRPDLGPVVIMKYRAMAGKKLDSEHLSVKGEHSIKLSVLELISGQTFSHATLTKDESHTLIKILVDNYNEKKKNTEIYGNISFSTCGWALNRLLISNKADEKFTIQNDFSANGHILTAEVLQKILHNAQQYLQIK